MAECAPVEAETLDDCLQEGDLVLMIPSADGQRFYILCKLAEVGK